MQTNVALLAGRIENWRLGPGGDNLRAAPYYTEHDDSPNFNRLFAAIYDIFFTKLTNMGRLIPSPGRTIKDIFKEKIYGTDKYLVSAELIVYLKWLIYVAAFKDRSNVQHEVFYRQELAMFKDGEQWRSQLYVQLEAWYKDYQPSRRRKSNTREVTAMDVVAVRRFKQMDEFVDQLADDVAAPAAAAAAAGPPAAAAAAAEGAPA